MKKGSNTVGLGVIALSLLALNASPVKAQIYQDAGIQVTIDRDPIRFNGQQPVEQEARVLVPLRGVLEKMGAFVRYDEQTKTVIALRGATRITLPVGSRQALVGEQPVSLDVPALIVNGSTMVPLRFVAESLGAQVAYNVGTRTVAISTGAAMPASPSVNAEPTGRASSAVMAPVESTVSGTISAIYPNLAPRRVVVRMDAGANIGQERTIPLRGDALITVQRRATGKDIPVTLERVRVGDTVQVRLTGDGAASSVEVTERAPDPNRTITRDNVPAARSARSARSTAAVTVFRGEFLDSEPVEGTNRHKLKMTDGRTIEVGGDATLLFGDQKVTFDDLRSGDQITIEVDPRTGRGTRVKIAAD